jgi:hypothetical protein
MGYRRLFKSKNRCQTDFICSGDIHAGTRTGATEFSATDAHQVRQFHRAIGQRRRIKTGGVFPDVGGKSAGHS